MSLASQVGTGAKSKNGSGLEPIWSTETDHRRPNDEEEYMGTAPDDIIPEHERTGCWHCLTRALKGIWATRQLTSDKKDRELYVKTTIRELVVYLIFLIILCILTFGMTSPTMYYYTKVMSELFLESPYEDTRNNFKGSTQVFDFWRFRQYVMIPSLYPEIDYNKARINKDERYVLYENRLLGVPRLRQLRVRSDSCNVHETFKMIQHCYDNYSPHVEDKDPFGKKNGTAWAYSSETELGGSSHWGLLATYSGAGYFQDLGSTRKIADGNMQELMDNLWIRRGTRAVFLDFTVYNANVNLFCVVKLVFEFPATGGMVPSWSIRTVKLIRYVSATDYFIMACECIFCAFILYYIIEECLEISKLKCEYFKSVWNILDIVVIVISCVCIAFSIYRTMSVSTMLQVLLEDPEIFPDFEFLGFWQVQFNNAVALAVFFAWIKLFKYISFNKTMNQLSSTLSRCAKDVAGFGIMFFIVFFAFAQLGYLLFGTQVRDFSTFMNAVFTLLRLILGDFNFHAIENANRILGPIYFICYVFFVFFVLLNMFLAIINDTYSEVKAEIALAKNEFEIADYFQRGFNNLMGKFGKRNQLVEIQNALKLADANGDTIVSYEEIRWFLKQRGFTDVEINMFFSKYDVNGDRQLNVTETTKIMADLEGERNDLDRQIKSEEGGGEGDPMFGASREEMNSLTQRVERMEYSIGSITSKIEAVLIKLEMMEKERERKKHEMARCVESVKSSEESDKSKFDNLVSVLSDQLGVPPSSSRASLRSPSPSDGRDSGMSGMQQ
ncbi:PKD2 (predicted) [Pycnogonum litorale]